MYLCKQCISLHINIDHFNCSVLSCKCWLGIADSNLKVISGWLRQGLTEPWRIVELAAVATSRAASSVPKRIISKQNSIDPASCIPCIAKVVISNKLINVRLSRPALRRACTVTWPCEVICRSLRSIGSKWPNVLSCPCCTVGEGKTCNVLAFNVVTAVSNRTYKSTWISYLVGNDSTANLLVGATTGRKDSWIAWSWCDWRSSTGPYWSGNEAPVSVGHCWVYDLTHPDMLK